MNINYNTNEEMKMTNENYRTNVLSTESQVEIHLDAKQSRLLHAAMGLCTEAGEIMDTLKKTFFYGKPLDKVNLKEESGDSEWYMEILIDYLESTREEIHQFNIDKLKKRYPDQKFTSADALNRNVKNELSHITIKEEKK